MTYFTEKEFRSPDKPNQPVAVNSEFRYLLDTTREFYGKSMIINSGYRTALHNKAVGGSSRSQHLKLPVVAADIKISNGEDRLDLLNAIFKAQDKTGIPVSLGFGKSFIHVDIRREPTSWTY